MLSQCLSSSTSFCFLSCGHRLHTKWCENHRATDGSSTFIHPQPLGTLLAHIEPLLRGKNLESRESLSCWWGFPRAKHSRLLKAVSGAGLFLKIAREMFLSSLETHYKAVMFFQMLPFNFLIIWLMFHILPALKDALRTHWLIGEELHRCKNKAASMLFWFGSHRLHSVTKSRKKNIVATGHMWLLPVKMCCKNRSAHWNLRT